MRIGLGMAVMTLALSVPACGDSDDGGDASAMMSASVADDRAAAGEATTERATSAGDPDGDDSSVTTTTAAGASDGETTHDGGETMGGGEATGEGESATEDTAMTTSTASETTTTTVTGSGATTTTAEPFQSDSSIAIRDFAFEPADLTVSQRTRVTTTNDDGATHTWTSDSGEWDSGPIVSGGSFTFSFTTVGTFAYHCEIHPSMTGSVTVT